MGYLKDFLLPFIPACSLWSSGRASRIPLLFKAKGMEARCRVFSVVSPHLWNRLPQDLRAAFSVCGFHMSLKITWLLGKEMLLKNPLHFYVALYIFLKKYADLHFQHCFFIGKTVLIVLLYILTFLFMALDFFLMIQKSNKKPKMDNIPLVVFKEIFSFQNDLIMSFSQDLWEL